MDSKINTSSGDQGRAFQGISSSGTEILEGRPLRTLNSISLESQSGAGFRGRLPDISMFNHSTNALNPAGALLPQGRLLATPNGATFPVRGSVSMKGFQPLVFERDRTSSAISAVVHVFVVAAVILGWNLARHAIVAAPEQEITTPLKFTLYDPPPIMPVAKVMGGGGGGGFHEPIPASEGRPPVVQKMPALAPQIIRIDHPKLEVEPASQVRLQDNNHMAELGIAHSEQVVLASQGAGSNSGFGIGMGGGIGQGHGDGAGAGNGGGSGGGLMTVGGGVSAPLVIHSVAPEFTEEARQANYQGEVGIQLIVDSQGNPQDVRITRHLGMGLDEKAIAAVRQYKFRPAMYQGHPVAVQLIIEVAFHLH